MRSLDKLLHLVGSAAAGFIAVSAGVGYQPPKGLAIAAGVAAYVAGAAAKSLVPRKKKP